ncbi:MAG: RidA family protein [bacterium]
MSILERLKELGIELPPAPQPVATYIPAVRTGNLVFTSGVLPMKEGKLAYTGKIGGFENNIEHGYEGAKLCVINALSVINDIVGLDNVVRIVKVVGFVNSDSLFTDQPKVINGASDLLGDVFGDKGKHARSAVGVNTLPLNSSVEVELIVEVI